MNYFATLLFAIICNGVYGAPVDSCEASKKEMVEALQDLFLVGDTDMLFPNNQIQIGQHCDKVEKLAREKLTHMSCMKKGSLKLIFGALSTGYVKVNQKRCSSKDWREKFLRLSDCVRKSDIAQDLHQCAYKAHDGLLYALKNFTVEHQLQFACCVFQNIDGCLHSALVKDCGDGIAQYGTQLFWEPISEAFTLSCPGITSIPECRKMYPKQMKDTDNIFTSTERLSPRNFLEVGYQIHVNRGEKMPEKVNV